MEANGPKIKFAIYMSSGVNFCLFVIQMYAAITMGSLSLFATAADAFMDLVSSCVMLGRTRIETIGIILFCALMTTVAVQLLIESGRALGAGAKHSEPLQIVPLVCVGVAIFSKFCMMVYCLFLRRYPACRVFFIDHRNDIVVNLFGLIMSIVGTRLVWWLDPFGAICIGLLIMFSWLLVGKGAPKEFISKVLYMTLTHDSQILKVDTCRAYHAGEKYYVELDIIMDENAPLKLTHDVSQTLQRKIEGLEDVERAFVHVDYDEDHDPHEEHKRVTPARKAKRSLKERMEDAKEMMATVIPGLGKND
ncbi:hypothetical protein BLS_004201 [Venturia inaequalis]|uniref:Cation efflux protein cytoplasmic domain-containing protein n=1 Tax=Venturia inaequalis TaxID=5025 RepID=A0A8H3UJZ6_VENIN|nr:hypothetical protein BLS_004201 [Venturia inaequalis]